MGVLSIHSDKNESGSALFYYFFSVVDFSEMNWATVNILVPATRKLL